MNRLLLILPIALAVFVSCKSDSAEKTDVAVQNSDKKNCQIASMTMVNNGSIQVMEFHYKDHILERIETIKDGKDLNTTIAFNFQDKGTLQSFLSGAVIARYVYNDFGNIVSINGERGMSTRSYEYDDQRRVKKQTVMHSETNFSTYIYEYDAKNQPVKVSLYDTEGDLVEVNELKFDNKKNPFRNRGIFVNSAEMVLGYPVGDCEHNLIHIKKMHFKVTNAKVGGRNMKPGEVENNSIGYSYNKQGFPTEMRRQRFGRAFVMKIAYDCY